MFRASLWKTFIGPTRPAWADQLLSPESLRAAGYCDPGLVASGPARTTQPAAPGAPDNSGSDMHLTSVVATQRSNT